MSAYLGGSPTVDPNQATLILDGAQFTGWQEIAVTRSLETMPSSFTILMTDPDDVAGTAITGAIGKAFQLKLGADLVLSGYIDRYSPFLRPGARGVRLQGRSTCADLVDCSIDETKLPGMQISGGTLAAIAAVVAKPYGVAVKSQSAGNNLTIPQLNVGLGERPFQLIERVARYEGVIAHDDETGALVLDAVGSTTMASGAVEGVNVQAASVTLSMDQRYSDVAVYQFTNWTSFDIAALPAPALAKDQGVPRYRRLVEASEQIAPGLGLAQQRANWEVARRYGRSQALSVTLDGWRDSAGKLWQVNALMSVDIPHVRVAGVTWLIAQVTFHRSGRTATTADLLLMPKEAFTPEPTLLFPFDPEIAAALQRNAQAASGSLGYAPGRQPDDGANYNPRRGDAAGV